MDCLYRYSRVPTGMNGQTISAQTCAREAPTLVLSKLFSLIIMTPNQQVGSSSYVINVAAPYSTHKCFAFVPACRAKSVTYSIPLTLLLQPK